MPYPPRRTSTGVMRSANPILASDLFMGQLVVKAWHRAFVFRGYLPNSGWGTMRAVTS